MSNQAKQASRDELYQLVNFDIANEEFGVDILKVQEIIRVPEVTRVPNCPEFVEGVISLRGKIVPVVDLRRRFKLPSIENDNNTRIIVVELAGQTVGFLVDRVKEVIRIETAIIDPPPELATSIHTDYITGVAKLEDRLLILLDLDRVLTTAEQELRPDPLRGLAPHHRDRTLAGGTRMKTMTTVEIEQELATGLKELRMPTMRACYIEMADLARHESLSYERYLLELLRREHEERRHNRIRRWLRQSGLPLEKALDGFDRGRLPVKVNRQLSVLLEGGFLDRRENVLAFGPPGSGKTHLLCAMGQELIHQGRRVLFRPCSLLVQELLIAKRDLVLARLLKRLSQYDALIIDDIGYVQQSREEMEVLFMLLAERYERGSVLLTSNLPFSKWEQIFKDPTTTAAAIDRLVHHSVILELNLPSYRLEASKRQISTAQ